MSTYEKSIWMKIMGLQESSLIIHPLNANKNLSQNSLKSRLDNYTTNKRILNIIKIKWVNN